MFQNGFSFTYMRYIVSFDRIITGKYKNYEKTKQML
jgi:hypothetical protein